MELSVFKNYKNKAIALFLLITIFSCKNNNDQQGLREPSANDKELISCEDSLWQEITQRRKKILNESAKEEKEIIENFRVMDKFLYSFTTLKSIHQDSLSIHAPLDKVNERVAEYNRFYKTNLDKNEWDTLPIFHSVIEYHSNKNYVCLIMKNELALYKSYGY